MPNDKVAEETKEAAEPTPKTPVPTLAKESSPQIVAEEPKAEYKVEKHVFSVHIPKALEGTYLKPDSSFNKIITALGVPQLAKHVKTDIPSNPINHNGIWCIGLDIVNEKSLMQANHPNILFSPDLTSLNTNEEKKAMYAPLKAFINSNLDSISQL